ncbi:MAG: hypothetical protein DSZ12_06585 [Sulfurovum sp.]|nr:MAG: hypothetical protein DSZ08_07125 [Sulfurovum sp.]RUM73841.1 MAG: hypothetical protein DSZ12_06585 [Sulfurovum sp.]
MIANNKVQQKRKNLEENGITFGMVSVIVMSMSIVLILALIKIYLSNQIYHESKIVNSMAREVAALKAESIMLEQNVEALKYKNQVTDTIFVIKE